MSIHTDKFLQLENKSEEEILKFLLENLIKKSNKGKQIKADLKNYREPSLKILIVQNYGINNPLDIPDILLNYYDKKNIKNIEKLKVFYDIHSFKRIKLNNNYFYIRLTNKKDFKKYHFIFKDEKRNWIIFTLTNKKDLGKTIRKIINFIPELKFTSLTQRQLENLAIEEEYLEYVKGFVAKYNAKYYNSERKLSFNVHGGTLEDLDVVRKNFPVEPTIIRFWKEHSPPVGISVFAEGFFTIDSIKSNGIRSGIKAIKFLEKFILESNEIFQNVKNFQNSLISVKKNKFTFARINSEYAIKMKVKKNRFSNNIKKDIITKSMLFEAIYLYFSNNKKKYFVNKCAKNSFILHDKDTFNNLQITIEKEEETNSIIIYPYKNCHPEALKDVCVGISNSVEGSFEEIIPIVYISN
ncbi:MAG: hypothetical protein ACTSWX_11090 [Promethearchaeota archaeon]